MLLKKVAEPVMSRKLARHDSAMAMAMGAVAMAKFYKH